MQRRDVSRFLFASAAGAALLAGRAEAQTCVPPCYPRSAAENGITLVDQTYPPGHTLRYHASSNTDYLAAIHTARDVAFAAGVPLQLPDGTVNVSDTLQLGRENLQVIGGRKSVLRFSSAFAKPVIAVDSIERGLTIYNVLLGNFRIDCNGGTVGLYVHGVGHSSFKNIRVFNCANTAYDVRWSVVNKWEDVGISTDEGPHSTTCQFGFEFRDGTNPGQACVANVFENLIVEGVSSTGIILTNAQNNVFIAGTSEGNGAGVFIGADSRYNQFLNMFCEVNNNYDLRVRGNSNYFEQCELGSTASGASVVLEQGAAFNHFRAGFIRQVDIGGATVGTRFEQVAFPSTGIRIVGSGPSEQLGCSLVTATRQYASSLNDLVRSVTLASVTPVAAPGQIALGTSTTGPAPLPAVPSGYWVINIGGSNYKVPYFA